MEFMLDLDMGPVISSKFCFSRYQSNGSEEKIIIDYGTAYYKGAAFELLKKYNKDPFHLHHALTVEGVMRWYAKQLGFAVNE